MSKFSRDKHDKGHRQETTITLIISFALHRNECKVWDQCNTPVGDVIERNTFFWIL